MSSEFLSSHRQTAKYHEIYNYELTVQWHKWAQKCNLTLAVSPTCPQHKPSAYSVATY